jgi:two-component sensor histidine kinase
VFHEIRVPLNTISLGLHVLTSGESLNRNELETVSMIKDAVGFMGDTLNDVMALQKIEEGSLALNYKSFTVQELLHIMEDSFAEHCAKSQIQLVIELDHNVPKKLIGDKLRIRHVLANLVSNAIKFSEKHTAVRLVVHCEKIVPSSEADPASQSRRQIETGTTAMIQFQIVDNGKGISEEDQNADIFQPYQQLKSGELTSGRGAGLGLAICRELVHLHGGMINYTSKLGQGTTFIVLLPLEVPFDVNNETSHFAPQSVSNGAPSSPWPSDNHGNDTTTNINQNGLRQRYNGRVTRSMAAAVSESEGWHTANPAPSDMDSDAFSTRSNATTSAKKKLVKSPSATDSELSHTPLTKIPSSGNVKRPLSKIENKDIRVLIVDGKFHSTAIELKLISVTCCVLQMSCPIARCWHFC